MRRLACACSRLAQTVLVRAASLEELRDATPTLQELPPGTTGRVVVEGPGLGPLADLAGAEEVWRRAFGQRGLEVLDVAGEGLSRAIVRWRVPAPAPAAGAAALGSPLPPLVLLGAIVLALAVLGWAVRQVIVLVDRLGPGVAVGLGVLLLLALVVIASAAPSPRRR